MGLTGIGHSERGEARIVTWYDRAAVVLRPSSIVHPGPPLRIALVAPYDLARAGGVATQIRGQARALRRLGHEVQIFGPASAPLADGEQSLGRSLTVTIGGTASGLGVDPRSARAVTRMLGGRFDVLHVHEPFTPLAPWLVLACAGRTPLVGTFHVHREHGHRLYAASAWMLAPLARRLRARIAVSKTARRTVAAHFPAHYDIVPNGIDVDAFRAPRSHPARFPADGRSLLVVGRLEPRKGLETMIHAVVLVRRRVPAVTLVIVGDGPERERLRALAGAADAPVVFAARVTDDELPAYFQAADIVCSPALGGESFGIVLLEAMACGKPVVASDIEGYADLIGTSGCARLVRAGDPAALANALTLLLEDESERRRLGDRGAALARTYDLDSIAPQLVATYRRVIAAANG